MSIRTNTCSGFMLCAVGVSVLPSYAEAGTARELLARSGDASPAQLGGEPISMIGAPNVSTSGAVAIAVVTPTPGPSLSGHALLRRLPAAESFEAVAWSGLETPRSGSRFESFIVLTQSLNDIAFFGFAPINAQGDVSFLATVFDEVPSEIEPNELQPAAFRIAADGDVQTAWQRPRTIPEIEGIEFVNGSDLPVMTEGGAFLATVFYNNESSVVLRLDDGGRSIAFNSLSEDETFEFGFPDVVFNSRGDAAFFGGSSRREQSLEFRTLSGDAAVVFDGGESRLGDVPVTFRSLDSLSLARDGAFAFKASVRNSETGQTIAGVWSHDATGLVPLAIAGEEAPGADGTLFASFGRTFAGSADTILFEAVLETPDGEPLPERDGLWLTGVNGAPALLAREGGEAPGVSGAIFDELGSRIAINASDDVVFLGRLADGVGGVDASVNGLGVWARDGATGEVTLLVRTGDEVDVSREGETPDPRTVIDIQFSSQTGLADNGRVGYTLAFADGTFAAFSSFVGQAPSACAADFDIDGDVDMGDFGRFSELFDSVAGDGRFEPRADFDHDGDVDLGDFGFFGAEFGRTDCAQ